MLGQQPCKDTHHQCFVKNSSVGLVKHPCGQKPPTPTTWVQFLGRKWWKERRAPQSCPQTSTCTLGLCVPPLPCMHKINECEEEMCGGGGGVFPFRRLERGISSSELSLLCRRLEFGSQHPCQAAPNRLSLQVQGIQHLHLSFTGIRAHMYIHTYTQVHVNKNKALQKSSMHTNSLKWHHTVGTFFPICPLHSTTCCRVYREKIIICVWGVLRNSVLRGQGLPFSKGQSSYYKESRVKVWILTSSKLMLHKKINGSWLVITNFPFGKFNCTQIYLCEPLTSYF